MSETIYSRQFLNSQLSFKRTTFSQEDRETRNFSKSMKKTRDSWKHLSNIKTTDNFRIINNNINKNENNIIISPINKIKSRNRLSNNNPIIPVTEHKFFNFKFNKAPTLKQNQREINNIIKRKKLKRMKELRNIYNNILINESKTFRNNLYVTGNGFLSQKNSKIRRNRSSDELAIKKYSTHKSINEINNSSAENSSLFSKTGFNFNSSKNFFDNETKTINKSKIFQEMEKSKNNSNYFLPILANIRRKSLITPLKSISKMRIMVNDVIFNELKSIKEFSDKENKMIKFRIIQNIQNKEIKNLKKNDEINLDNRLNKLIELKVLFENHFETYSYNMHYYLNFLKDKLYEIQENLQIIDKDIFNQNMEIEKLALKIVKKQNELESLIEIRNFLLQVKDKYEHKEKSPSYYYQLFIKDSKKLLIGNYFLKLKIINHITNKSMTSFMSSVLELKEKIEDNKISIYEDFDFNLNYFKKEKIKPVFESVDEFMKLYNSHMEKNMNYLQEFGYIKKVINRLKDEYEEICVTDNNNKSLLEDEIIEKQELLETLIKRNEILKKRFIYYKDYNQKKRTQIEINEPKRAEKIPSYLNIEIDLDLIYREKYNNKLKTLKYNGILLFTKIANAVRNFFKINYIKKAFYEMKKDKLKLLELKEEDFNNDNIQSIDEYILKLISVYEDICKYILCNHKKYLSDKKNLDLIRVKQEEINNEKKLRISREQRKMKIIKKNEEKEKIIEKCYKPIVYIENKMITDTKIKRRKILKIKEEKNLEDEEKNFAENEFNYFTKYNDDDI